MRAQCANRAIETARTRRTVRASDSRRSSSPVPPSAKRDDRGRRSKKHSSGASPSSGAAAAMVASQIRSPRSTLPRVRASRALRPRCRARAVESDAASISSSATRLSPRESAMHAADRARFTRRTEIVRRRPLVRIALSRAAAAVKVAEPEACESESDLRTWHCEGEAKTLCLVQLLPANGLRLGYRLPRRARVRGCCEIRNE